MPLRYVSRILDHLAREHGRQADVHAIAIAMRARGDDKDVLRESIEALLEDGRIEQSGDFLRLPSIGAEVVGIYRSTRRGFGFVTPETPVREGDVYIALGAAEGAISGRAGAHTSWAAILALYADLPTTALRSRTISLDFD